MKLHFIEAESQEIPQIIDLAEKIWLPSFARYFEQDELNSLFSGMYNPEKLADTLRNSDYQFFFVQDPTGKTIGYFATENQGSTLKLDKIYVDPSLQRQGFGENIYHHIIRLAKEKGATKISLNVNRRNSSAIHFYLKLGFKIVRSEDIPGPNGFIYDDFVMEIFV